MRFALLALFVLSAQALKRVKPDDKFAKSPAKGLAKKESVTALRQKPDDTVSKSPARGLVKKEGSTKEVLDYDFNAEDTNQADSTMESNTNKEDSAMDTNQDFSMKDTKKQEIAKDNYDNQEKKGRKAEVSGLKTLKSYNREDKGAYDNVIKAQKKAIAAEKGTKEFTNDQAILEDRYMITHYMVVPELKPSDFKITSASQLAYLVSNGAVMLLIALIYFDRGLGTVLAIMALVLSLSFMSNTIQNIYHHGFKYPQFITSCHQLCSSIAAYAILLCRKWLTGHQISYPSIASVLKGLGPVALCFAASLGCSNLALLHANTHFYEMLTPVSPLMTFAIGMGLGYNKSMKLLPPVMLVAVAMPLVAIGDVQTSALGLLFVIAGALFRAIKAQINSLLMSPDRMPQIFDPLELACWTTILTFLVMMTWSLTSEGLAPFQTIVDDSASATLGVFGALMISCVNAVVLNLSVLFVLKEIGPVAQQILGELKGILASLGAVAAFGETVTAQQIVAYSLAIIGVHWYNKIDMQVRDENAQAAKKLVENTDERSGE